MRSITPGGWVVIAALTIAVFWWWAGAADEADVPSYREHRQGSVVRDSDIESPLQQCELPCRNISR